ncbi:hypothetical protein Pelo_19922 [Pelomyxa schiedti]|nr:hypothetical protein Pelo_19922 [Pelomyxa schiedti]
MTARPARPVPAASALAIANLLAGGAVARNVAEIPMSMQLGYCPETRVCRGTKWAVLWHPLLGGIVILRMCGGLERARCGGGGKEDFCVVGLRGYVTSVCMINDDEAALVAPSPAVEGKTDMVNFWDSPS